MTLCAVFLSVSVLKPLACRFWDLKHPKTLHASGFRVKTVSMAHFCGANWVTKLPAAARNPPSFPHKNGPS